MDNSPLSSQISIKMVHLRFVIKVVGTFNKLSSCHPGDSLVLLREIDNEYGRYFYALNETLYTINQIFTLSCFFRCI